MIASVTGRLVSRGVALVELETSGGTGYEVHIPLSVFEKLPADGERLTLYTHLVVREDAWELYGFGSRFERAVFRRLLSAKGVGPALALGIISTLGAERVVDALRTSEVTTFVRVPRVGRKKAEQIVLDLADKVDDLTVATAATGRARSGAATVGGGSDAVRALIALGYPEHDAREAVREAGVAGDVAATVRAALALLNG